MGCSQESVVWDKIITRDSPHTDRIKITPDSRRECPNPRTPYCHYYYNNEYHYDNRDYLYHNCRYHYHLHE